MEKIIPLDIPLLNREICLYLSQKDLSRCTLVSKAWSTWFSPALWRDVSFHRGTPDLDILSKQQEHIRTVRSLSMTDARVIRDRVLFPNLQRLEFAHSWDGSGMHRIELRVLRMLEGTQTLRHLKISLALHHHDVHQQWIRTLQALPHIKKLELSCHQFVGGIAIHEFLQQCRRYEYLGLEFAGYYSHMDQEDREECQTLKAAIGQMQDMQLRGLSFSTTFSIYSETILQPLLERCPLLETLDLEKLNHAPTLTHVASILKDKRLPRLRRWRTNGENFQDAHVELLSSIGCGLESFGIIGEPGIATSQALIQYHAHSLADLDMNISPVTLLTFSDLLAGLPGLRSAKAHVSTGGTDDDFDRAMDVEWACVELRTLDLHLITHTGHRKRARRIIGGREWRGSRAQRCLDYVFSQITKLRDLERLQLGSSQEDLFIMKRGYLGQLAGLKRLQAFNLEATPPGNFGELEASWMARNWPRLAQVKDRGATEIFRTALRAKRPLIQFD